MIFNLLFLWALFSVASLVGFWMFKEDVIAIMDGMPLKGNTRDRRTFLVAYCMCIIPVLQFLMLIVIILLATVKIMFRKH